MLTQVTMPSTCKLHVLVNNGEKKFVNVSLLV